jgi:hypothetical protein
MPTHSLVAYKFGLREKGETNEYWPLNDLHSYNPNLPDDDIIESIDRFFNGISKDVQKYQRREKAYIVEDYYSNDNIAEAIVATGNYGYAAELRDISSGKQTHQKTENEAEFMRYYLLFWMPQTIKGVSHDNGEHAVVVFQNISGGGIKTIFHHEFKDYLLRKDNNTVFRLDPAVSQDVLSKVINSEGVKKVTFDLKKSPQNTDQAVKLIEGMDTQDVEQEQMIWKPGHGGFINSFKRKARELNRSGSDFASIAGDDTDDIHVTIQRDDGRKESFSIIDNLPKMRVHLSPSSSETDHGLPITQYLCDEACYTINRLYDQDIVQTINYDTKL